MATQEQATATLVEVKGKLEALTAAVTALKDQASNAGQVKPELQAAIDGVVAVTDGLNALVTPSATPEGQG